MAEKIAPIRNPNKESRSKPTPQVSEMQIVLGCDRGGHINPAAGIFGILEEKFRKIKRNPIPARSNTSCACRRTSKCKQDCIHAVYGIRAGFKISWRIPGLTL